MPVAHLREHIRHSVRPRSSSTDGTLNPSEFSCKHTSEQLCDLPRQVLLRGRPEIPQRQNCRFCARNAGRLSPHPFVTPSTTILLRFLAYAHTRTKHFCVHGKLILHEENSCVTASVTVHSNKVIDVRAAMTQSHDAIILSVH